MEVDSFGVPLPAAVLGVGASLNSCSRAVRRASRGLRQRARSLLRDALFVDAAWAAVRAAAGAPLPLFLNARCGLWYAPAATGACCFKSSDGHAASAARKRRPAAPSRSTRW